MQKLAFSNFMATGAWLYTVPTSETYVTAVNGVFKQIIWENIFYQISLARYPLRESLQKLPKLLKRFCNLH